MVSVQILALLPMLLGLGLILGRHPIANALLSRTSPPPSEQDRMRSLFRGLLCLGSFALLIGVAGSVYAWLPAWQSGIFACAIIIAVPLNFTYIYFFRSAGLKWF